MILEKFNPVIPLEDDGFATDQALEWSPKKNQIIRHYLQVFSGTMERKFNYLVYLDLFAGSGLQRQSDGTIIGSSVVEALSISPGFSKYIFCDHDQRKVEALRIRTNKYGRDKNAIVFQGTPNNLIEKLVYYIPESTKRDKVSTLCLIDAGDIDIDFDTVRLLAELGVNFLFILSFPWEDDLAFQRFIEEKREMLHAFLGKPWSQYEAGLNFNSNEVFFRNLVKIYHQNLRELGYLAKGSFHKFDAQTFKIPFFFAGYYSSTVETKRIHSQVKEKFVEQVKLFG